MSEVQNHGFVFQDWVEEVLGIKKSNYKYTDKWDIPGKIPISIKCMKSKGALEFGSAVRFWETNETFILIVGRWKQSGKNKIITSIDEIKITPEILKKLKGSITLKELTAFDNKIKSFPAGKVGQKEGISFARNWKTERKERMGLMTITHKIDSKSQRRVQCNLNFTNYIKLFGEPSVKAILRTKTFSNEISHASRIFKK